MSRASGSAPIFDETDAMRIQSLRVPAAHSTHSLQINDLGSGLNVIHGPNGSGKTQVARALEHSLVESLFRPAVTAPTSFWVQALNAGQLIHLPVSAAASDDVSQSEQERLAAAFLRDVFFSHGTSHHRLHRLTRWIADYDHQFWQQMQLHQRELSNHREHVLQRPTVRTALADLDRIVAGRCLRRGWNHRRQVEQASLQLEQSLQNIARDEQQQREQLEQTSTRTQQLQQQLNSLRQAAAAASTSTSKHSEVTQSDRDREDLERQSTAVRQAIQVLRQRAESLKARLEGLNQRLKSECQCRHQDIHQQQRHALRSLENLIARQALEQQHATNTDAQHAAAHREQRAVQSSTTDAIHELCRLISHCELHQRHDDVRRQLHEVHETRQQMEQQIEWIQHELHTQPAHSCHCRQPHGSSQSAELNQPSTKLSWDAQQSDESRKLAGQASQLEQQLERLESARRQLEHALSELSGRRQRLKVELDKLRQQHQSSQAAILHSAIEYQQAAGREARRVRAWVDQAQQIQHLSGGSLPNGVQIFQEASDILKRLSDGCLDRIEFSERSRAVIVRQQPDQWCRTEQLGEGLRELVILSLRLSLITRLSSTRAHWPLVLDDEFGHLDHPTARRVVELLYELGEQGQQIICLSCHEHIWDFARQQQATVRQLQPPRVTATLPKHPLPPQPVASKPDAPKVPQTLTAAAATPPVQRTDRPHRGRALEPRLLKLQRRKQRRRGGKYRLEITSSIAECPSIHSRLADQLEVRGVRTAGDLLELLPDNFARQHQELKLDPVDLFALQSQTLLMIQVPMLDESSAQVLVQSGYTTPRQLAATETSRVIRAAQRTLAGPAWRELPEWRRVELLRESPSWTRRAHQARSLWNSREPHAKPQRFESQPTTRTPRSSQPGIVAFPAEQRQSSRDRVSRHQPLATSRSDAAPQRPPGIATRFGQPSDKPGSRPAVNSTAETGSHLHGDRSRDEDAQLRFYLHRHSPIEDAPEIGPKMGQRLERIGIRTVADLLNGRAEDVSRQLRSRRVKPRHVRNWQLQSELMCRVPQLRGHDVQILVACKLSTPEQIAAMTPDDLFAIVQPFSETRQGERIIRSGRKPDLDEVTNWIAWAKQARQLRAA